MNNQNSRYITYPSVVDKVRSTALIIDLKPADFIVLNEFLQASEQDFDIYLYDAASHDLEWLNHAATRSDVVLIDNTSQVTIVPTCTNIRYGQGQDVQSPLAYFTKLVDSLVETSV